MPLNLGSSVRMLKAFSLLLFIVPATAFAQDGTVQTKLSANTITRDESVTLEITAIGMDKELDLSSLYADFEVVGRSSSREVRSVMEAGSGMRTTSFVTWAVELVPRDVGVFTVPPVRVGNVPGQAHTLTVNEIPTGAQRDIFVEASVDTQTPWVQSQVLMTLKVYQAINIVDGGLDVPESENLIVERLGDDVRSQENRDGRQYSVTTRRFALFPQKSGELVLDPITLSVSVPADPSRVRGFFSPTRKLSRRTDRIVLNVKPRSSTDSAWWLPAKAVQLDSQWIGDVSAATVDQPLTRTIVLRASGVTDSQLPEINIPAIEGASLYAQEPERKLGANQQGVLSELAIKWAVIPQRVGELVLPAVSVDWFNTTTGSVETAVLPAETITINPAQANLQANSQTNSASNNAALNTTESASQSAEDTSALTSQGVTQSELTQSQEDLNAETRGNAEITDVGNTSDAQQGSTAMLQRVQELENAVSQWRNVAMAILALWLLSSLAFIWMRYKQRKHSDGTDSSSDRLGAVRNAAANSLARMQPLGGVVASCKAGSPEQVRHALLEWSTRQWPEASPSTLSALVKHLPDGAAKDTIESLDAALYSHRADDSAQLQTQLAALPDSLQKELDKEGANNTNFGQSSQVISAHSLPSL